MDVFAPFYCDLYLSEFKPTRSSHYFAWHQSDCTCFCCLSNVCCYDLSLRASFHSSVWHTFQANKGNRRNIVKETVADEKLIKQACSRRGAVFPQNKSHYLSCDQTAAETAPVLHLITLFNPKCCTPLIPPLFSLFEQTGSRHTDGLLANVFFFLLCCKENTRGLTKFFDCFILSLILQPFCLC